MDNLLDSDHRELDVLLDKVFAAFEAADAELTFQKLDFFWARLAMHIRAEHLHLFPAIVAVAPDTQDIIRQLKDDHNFFMRELSAVIKQLRDLSKKEEKDASSLLSKACERIRGVRHWLDAHNKLEETKVYIIIDRLLAPTEHAELYRRIKKELDNLPPRFSHEEGL